jgi:hypothetical protein
MCSRRAIHFELHGRFLPQPVRQHQFTYNPFCPSSASPVPASPFEFIPHDAIGLLTAGFNFRQSAIAPLGGATAETFSHFPNFSVVVNTSFSRLLQTPCGQQVMTIQNVEIFTVFSGLQNERQSGWCITIAKLHACRLTNL